MEFCRAVTAAAAELRGSEEKTIQESLWYFFSSIDSGPTHEELAASGAISRALEHPSLNRYCDCFPLDAHLARSVTGRYINASLVQLRQSAAVPRTIVAAGPMAPKFYGPDTRGDFWGAVWAHQVQVIVALATPEKGVQGCAEYAYDGQYDDIQVRLLHEKPVAYWGVERTLELNLGSTVREVTQLEFSAWPNYGVPGAASSVAALATRVCQLVTEAPAQGEPADVESEAAPLLIHCAGGVGRSGSFATLLSLWMDRDDLHLVTGADVFATVQSRVEAFRRQRHPYGVETPEQLGMIIDVLEVLCTSEHSQ